MNAVRRMIAFAITITLVHSSHATQASPRGWLEATEPFESVLESPIDIPQLNSSLSSHIISDALLHLVLVAVAFFAGLTIGLKLQYRQINTTYTKRDADTTSTPEQTNHCNNVSSALTHTHTIDKKETAEQASSSSIPLDSTLDDQDTIAVTTTSSVHAANHSENIIHAVGQTIERDTGIATRSPEVHSTQKSKTEDYLVSTPSPVPLSPSMLINPRPISINPSSPVSSLHLQSCHEDADENNDAIKLLFSLLAALHIDPGEMATGERLQLVQIVIQAWNAQQTKQHAMSMERYVEERFILKSIHLIPFNPVQSNTSHLF